VAGTRHLETGLPAVLADAVQLQQVLLNLVINACDAMEALPPPDRRLHLQTSSDPVRGVAVRVRDSGPGIPEELRARIFEPFVTSKTNHPGLGLAICRSIVAAHDGSLEVEEASGGGTEFVVWLPPAK
jgi:two-component system sensor histidine kinase DctS